MKILHLVLSNYYMDNCNYQENALTRQNMKDGHDVRIFASSVVYKGDSSQCYIEPSTYVNEDGILVTRLPYRKNIMRILAAKIRAYPNLYKMIEEYAPDLIFFHGVQSYELLTVAKYKQNHPEIKLYMDNHSDSNNSASNFFSREILHKIFYKKIIKKTISYINKIFYISIECGDFLRNMYDVPMEKMEFYPLGGDIIEGNQYVNTRESVRRSLSINDDNILLVHSGKINKYKKTIELLRAFKHVDDDRFRLLILGTITDDIKTEFKELIKNDNRVIYLGWQDAEKLLGYLCAADIYVQPGSQSATMQNAVCCGCPVMLYPHKSHKPYIKGNGFYVETIQDMIDCLMTISKKPEILQKMSEASYVIAHELLDYKKLAERLYS